MRDLVRFQLSKSAAAVGRALGSVVVHAARTVPHYRDLFASAAVQVESIDSEEALRELPVTHRSLLTQFPRARFLCERAEEGRLHASHTSGSTGTPATIFLSSAELYYRRLLLFRAIRRRFPGCLTMRVADVGQMTTQKASDLTRRLGPFRLTRIPGNRLVAEQAELYVQAAPQLLQGYAGCLELLAQELAHRGNYPRPRWVISRGEVLLPSAREFLGRAFQCPVADFYNSEEVGNIAWECRERPGILHVNTDACVVELLDKSGSPTAEGEEGRVVVTNLYNYSMPFVRYDTGDHATWDRAAAHVCRCGAETPTLASIDGRTDDFLVLPDGSRVSPLVVLTTALNACAAVTPAGAHVAEVYQFQIVQKAIGEAEVRVVPLGTQLPADLDARLEREFQRLHPAFRVRAVACESIAREPSGKLRRVIAEASTQDGDRSPPSGGP